MLIQLPALGLPVTVRLVARPSALSHTAQLQGKWERVTALTDRIADAFPEAYERYESEDYDLACNQMLGAQVQTKRLLEPVPAAPAGGLVNNQPVIINQPRPKPRLQLKKFAGDFQE